MREVRRASSLPVECRPPACVPSLAPELVDPLGPLSEPINIEYCTVYRDLCYQVQAAGRELC